MPAPDSTFLSQILIALKEHLDQRSLNVKIKWRILVKSPEVLWSGSEYGRIVIEPVLTPQSPGNTKERINLSLSLILAQNTSDQVDDIWAYNWMQWLIEEAQYLAKNGAKVRDSKNRVTNTYFSNIIFQASPTIRRNIEAKDRELTEITYSGQWLALHPF